MAAKLKKEVLEEIDKFEDPEIREKTLAAAIVVAGRLNKHTNRLNLVSDIKLIATVVAHQPAPMSQLQTCMGVDTISGKITITDALNELRAAIEDNTDAKQQFHTFLRERLEGFMLPPEKDTNDLSATAVLKATAATSPLAQNILYAVCGIQGNTDDVRKLHKDIDERLMA